VATVRSVLAAAAVALAVAVGVAGCGGSNSSAPLGTSQPSAPASTASSTNRVDLSGLSVTLEVTSSPPGGDSWLQDGMTRPPQPTSGNRVMWLRLTVANATDATIAARVGHNYPSVHDSAGRLVRRLLPAGSRGAQRELPPHASTVSVVPYDVQPARQSYNLAWQLSDDRVAQMKFSWP
jgi:hypothetical protein